MCGSNGYTRPLFRHDVEYQDYTWKTVLFTLGLLTLCTGVLSSAARAADSSGQQTPTPVTNPSVGLSSSASGTKIQSINLWLGRTPPKGQQGVAQGNLKTFDMRGLKIDELETYDVQYDKIHRYRGIHLRDLIAVMNPIPLAADMLILHTNKGLLIPIAVKDLTEDREIFVASQMFLNNTWTEEFPAPSTASARAVTFEGNKLVAGTHYRAVYGKGFNPWLYASSLVAIELVESKAYYGSFSRDDGRSTALGHTIYQGRCWMCHAVQGLGGTLGPDLTKSKVLDHKKGIKEIQRIVAGHSPSDKSTDLPKHLMPYQRDFTKKEAKSLWFWLRDMRKGSLTPYKPTYESSVEWQKQ